MTRKHGESTAFAMGAALALPREAVTHKFAFLGTSGSGKTYGAGLLVEGLLDLQQQVVVVDIVGNWWGLRVGSDGKGSPGKNIAVLGGDRGDLPLAPEHGELMALTIASSRSSMVLDISDFTEAEIKRFVIAFATTLLQAKKKSPTPLMVVWEECQDIIPQTMFGDDARMVGAVQRLVKRGRNYGIGTTLISQRPAAVNKGCLNMIETMFAFRTLAPLDRKAIGDWVNATAADTKKSPLTDRLPELHTGTAILFSPQWLERREVVILAEKQTFNASATPDHTALAKVTLGPVDLAELEQKLKIVVEDKKANDTTALKARIKELEGQLAHGSDAQLDRTRLVDANERFDKLERRYRDVFAREEATKLAYDRLRDGVTAAARALADGLHRAEDTLSATSPVASAIAMNASFMQDVRETVNRVLPVNEEVDRQVATAMHARHERTKATSRKVTPTTDLSRMERTFLTALAQFGACTKARLRTITGYASSGPVSTAFAKLVAMKWVTEGGELAITAAGRAALGDYERLPQGDDLRAKLLNGSSTLSTMEKKLLLFTCEAYPSRIGKADVRERAGYAASGPVSAAFARLVAYGYLISDGKNFVKASPELFG